MKLSIVIPVYNTVLYLSRCLDSCVMQNVVDYEIILVNDGSSDSSQDIIEKYASSFPFIKFISQENSGLSVARNHGLQIAAGEYIWFVDSDDWIEENCLSKIFEKLTGADLVQLQYRYVFDDSMQNRDVKIWVDEGKTGKEILLQGGVPAPAQFTIYRREFLRKNNLSFVPGIYHEDLEFKPRALYFAESVAMVEQVCYNYYQRTAGSITSVFKIKNAKDILFVMNSIYDFSKNKERKYQRAFYSAIGMIMNTLLFGMRDLREEERTKIMKKLSSEKHLFRAMTRSKNLKYVIEGVVFSLSISLGLKLHCVIKV